MRTILHCDINNFYASVEMLHNPGLRGKPMAVCGDPEARHGIVLAKSNEAKRFGVQTAEPIWQAKQKCPSLIVVVPHFPNYLAFSNRMRQILGDYSDRIEPYGLDEAWVDVTASRALQGDGRTIADEIRRRTRAELGLTCSIGVADNKIFAKLGSDMRKPDATTVILPEDKERLVWPLPAKEMLFVGPATSRRLNRAGIATIGDIARHRPQTLRTLLGKWGESLWVSANGLDDSPVAPEGHAGAIKSIGNSTTTPRDLTDEADVYLVVLALAESVGARLRESGLRCATVQLYVRDVELHGFERQAKLGAPTHLGLDLARLAMRLFRESYGWEKPIRSVGVRGADVTPLDGAMQLCMLEEARRRQRMELLEFAVDGIRGRFGDAIIQRGVLLSDRRLTHISHVSKDLETDVCALPAGQYYTG